MRQRTYRSLRAYLDGTKTTQQQLAIKLGITQAALSMIKNGQRLPSPALALRIHDITGIPLENILQRAEVA